jgi:hypothetical protein
MRQRRDQRLQFLIAAAVTFCLCIFLLNWIVGAATYVPKNKFPDLTRVFIATYKRGNSEHYIFRHGLFGVSAQIKQSKILLSGSSHMEFGISALELGRYLSRTFKREIKAYNVGVGFADGPPFANLIFGGNDVRNVSVIIDGFGIGDKLSNFGEIVAKKDIFTSYVAVFENWTDFIHDWCLDGVLPRLELQAGAQLYDVRLVKKRFLQWPVILRLWDTGDVVSWWDPERGEIFDKPDSDASPDLGSPEPLKSSPTEIERVFGQRGLVPALTLIPYKGYDTVAAAQIARNLGWNYLPITAEKLNFADENLHVTALTRGRITQQIAQQLLHTRVGTFLNRQSSADVPSEHHIAP